MRLDSFYGRRIKRRAKDQSARPEDLRPDDLRPESRSQPLLIPEVGKRAAPSSQGRAVKRPKPRA